MPISRKAQSHRSSGFGRCKTPEIFQNLTFTSKSCMLGLYNRSGTLKKVAKTPLIFSNQRRLASKSCVGRHVVDIQKLVILNPLRPKGLRAFFGRHLVDTSLQISYPSLPRKRESLLIPLQLLLPRKAYRLSRGPRLISIFEPWMPNVSKTSFLTPFDVKRGKTAGEGEFRFSPSPDPTYLKRPKYGGLRSPHFGNTPLGIRVLPRVQNKKVSRDDGVERR